MRSYDGFDDSNGSQLIADNPPDAGNRQPVFDQSGWVESVTLYCEENSQSADRCTTFEINLLDFFSDPDPNQELILSVYDDEEIASDDEVVISVSADGVARYNPTSMAFFDPEISGWSINDVVFVASDQFGSKANSIPMSIEVIAIDFRSMYPKKQGFPKMVLLSSPASVFRENRYSYNRRNSCQQYSCLG